MKKQDDKQKLFEIMEKIDSSFKPTHKTILQENKLNERNNPIIGTVLANDKNFKYLLKNIKDWFTGKAGYIESSQIEHFKNLAIDEIVNLLNDLTKR
jgi:hypothetical protein